MDIRQAMTDPALLGAHFGGESWAAWRALYAGFYALPMDDAELSIFCALTGLQAAPEAPATELWVPVGRRGGKSNGAAGLAVFEACFFDHSDKLAPGEVATVMVVAADRKQARQVFRYIRGLLRSNPMLERMIVRETAEEIELNNRTVIEVMTASHRSIRGYSVSCAILDEVAFWHSEGANPDAEIIAALRPALATLDGKLVALSSPYARRGVLWDAYRRYYGKPGPVLVAKAPTLTMNPTLPARVVQEAYDRDPIAAAAEYGAEFRTDVEAFLTRETVEAAMREGPLELPYNYGLQLPRDTGRSHRYTAFVDPSGGGQDEFTLAIGHTEGERVIVDVLRARRGVPADIVAEYAALLKDYGIRQATADRYAGSWPADEFSRHGIELQVSEQPKSGLYLDTLAALNSGRVELPPDEKMLNQFVSLERRTARGGRESIDHPPGGHDDRANAVAGLVAHAKVRRITPLSAWL